LKLDWIEPEVDPYFGVRGINVTILVSNQSV